MEKGLRLARRASALVVNDGKVLAVRGLYGDDSWGFPFYDVMEEETEEEALKRGLFEDFQMKVSVDHHIGRRGSELEDGCLLRQFYVCTLISGEIPSDYPKRTRWLNRKEIRSYLWHEEDDGTSYRIQWYLECGTLKVRYVGESVAELTDGKVYPCNLVIDSELFILDNTGWEHFYNPTGIFVAIDRDEDNIQQIGHWEVVKDDKDETMNKLIHGWIRVERTDGIVLWAAPEFQEKFNSMLDELRNKKE